MKTTKRTFIMLLLVLLATGATQSAEKQAAAVSNTRTASCLVKIRCDPAILPLSYETIDYLLHSSGVGGKAARDILNISPNQAYDLFTIEYVQLGASDDLGGVGIPPSPWRAGRSGIGDGSEMSEYDEMMMEKERGKTSIMQPGNSSSTARSRSSSRRTTASRTQPTTGSSYSSRRRGRGGDYYGYIATPSTPQQRIGIATTVSAAPTEKQTYLFSLSVDLPEEVKPAAKEFMKALVDNLRESLHEAYQVYSRDLEILLEDAESQRDHAQSQLAKAIEQTKAIVRAPAIGLDSVDVAVYEQLEQIVDLSNLTSSTSFVDVIEELENSVDPPLQIQPNWKDLLENGEVEQTTPAGMDPLASIKLRKALEVLLAGVSGDFAELKYVVDEGVILIATEATLPSKMVPRVYEIPALAYSAGAAKNLVRIIQEAIEPESWYDTSDTGEGTISVYLDKKLAILQTYEIHQKIQKFLQTITIDVPAGTPLDIPVEIHLNEKNNLLREKQNLEMELARLQGRMPAIEEQIKRINMEIREKVQEDQVSEELRKILAMQIKYLEGVKKLVDDGDINGGVADAEEKIARAKIELARRNEQIGTFAGTDQLAKFSNELAMLAIDMAEQKAMLEIVSNQLNLTEQQLTASTILDPQVSKIRFAVRAFEIADRRVNELNTLALNVQPPTVSVLGAE